MALILKQGTAVDVLIGPFVDAGDATTAETGLSPSVRLSKNGQGLAAKSDSTTPVHDSSGYYNCEFDSTDTGTVGTLVAIVAGDSVSLPVRHEFQVVEEVIYDAIWNSSAAAFDSNQRVDVGSWLGTAVTTSSTTSKPQVDVYSISDDQTAADNAEAMFDGTGYVGGTERLQVDVVELSGDSGAADNAKLMFDGTGYAGGTERLQVDVVEISGDSGAADNAELMFDGTGYAGGTTKLDVNIASTDDIDLSATQKASVNTQVDNAIETYHLDHLLAVDYDPASPPGTSTALLNELIESDSGVSRFTSGALAQAPTGGSAPTAAAIADAVWEELIADHSGTSGSTAEALDGASAPTAAQVASAVLTTAMTESYASAGDGMTLAQAAYMMVQRLMEMDKSSTTITVKKRDGTSTAFTITLDDSRNPTTSTQAT